MKKIPETFELDEADIRQAITLWLNQEHGDGEYDHDFKINFKVERKEGKPPPGAPTGGMSDWSVEVVTAVAEKD